jgi:putative transposase
VKINKAYKIKIHPTARQRALITKHFGACRWVYNAFLQYKTDQYKKTKKSASWLEMNKLLTQLKKEPGKGWLNEVSRKALNGALEDLDSAFNNFFRKVAKYPKFKNKYSKQSYRVDNQAFRLLDYGILVQKIGELKCEINLPEEYKLLSITISKTTTGKYYASINYEMEIPEPKVDKTKPVIGIDFGLKTFITTSEGQKIEHPQPFLKQLKKLKRQQKKFSRKKNKASKRRAVQRRKIAVLHERIAGKRRNFLHKLSSRLVDENQAIYLEDLALKGMQNRWGCKIGDLGWYEFTRQLTYKGKWYGCLVEKRDRFFPSSKICSVCGWVNNSLTLNDREWKCANCGVQHDRDVNAAINILNYGPTTRNLRIGREGAILLNELSRQEQPGHNKEYLTKRRKTWEKKLLRRTNISAPHYWRKLEIN